MVIPIDSEQGVVIMYIDQNNNPYFGDMQPGDREATAQEVAAWEESRKPTYTQLRAAAYPPITDYLDGLVKGDAAQTQAYRDACLAVKLRYPKP